MIPLILLAGAGYLGLTRMPVPQAAPAAARPAGTLSRSVAAAAAPP